MIGEREATIEDTRPRRPVLVELASAILVIGSGIDTAISVEGMAVATTPEARFLAAASVAVGFGLMALGILVRSGRAWLLAVNVVAVAAFLELRSVTLGGVFAAMLDMVVVGVLLRERWWFRWTPPESARRVPGPAGGVTGDDRHA